MLCLHHPVPSGSSLDDFLHQNPLSLRLRMPRMSPIILDHAMD